MKPNSGKVVAPIAAGRAEFDMDLGSLRENVRRYQDALGRVEKGT